MFACLRMLWHTEAQAAYALFYINNKIERTDSMIITDIYYNDYSFDEGDGPDEISFAHKFFAEMPSEYYDIKGVAEFKQLFDICKSYAEREKVIINSYIMDGIIHVDIESREFTFLPARDKDFLIRAGELCEMIEISGSASAADKKRSGVTISMKLLTERKFALYAEERAQEFEETLLSLEEKMLI